MALVQAEEKAKREVRDCLISHFDGGDLYSWTRLEDLGFSLLFRNYRHLEHSYSSTSRPRAFLCLESLVLLLARAGTLYISVE